MPRKTRPKRWALFVEGTKTLTPHRRAELVELWHELVSKMSNLSTKLVDVHGFTKFQLVAMGGDSQSSPVASGDSQKIPLDAVIAITHQREPFDILVVAFDAHPANQRLQPTKHGKLASATVFRPCQVDEVAFVLHQFANSRILPDEFKLESASLLECYQQQPKPAPRGKGRPPRGLLDLLYMDPEFEALVTSDDAAVRAIFSFPKKPKDWPTLPPKMQRMCCGALSTAVDDTDRLTCAIRLIAILTPGHERLYARRR